MNKILIFSNRICNDNASKKIRADENINDIKSFYYSVADISLLDYSGLIIDLQLKEDTTEPKLEPIVVVPSHRFVVPDFDFDMEKKIEDARQEMKQERENTKWERFLDNIPVWLDDGNVIVLLDGNGISDLPTMPKFVCHPSMEHSETNILESLPENTSVFDHGHRTPEEILKTLDINSHILLKPTSEIKIISSDISGFNPQKMIAYRTIDTEKESEVKQIAVIDGRGMIVSCAIKRGKGYIIFLPKITGKDYFQNILKVLNYYMQKITTEKETKKELIFKLQLRPKSRPHKSFFAELVIFPGRGEEEKTCPLGPRTFRFLHLVLDGKFKVNEWIDAETLESELHYDNSKNPYWFSRRISSIKDWLNARKIIKYFEFQKSEKREQVRTTLLREQFIVDIPDYEEAKKRTKIHSRGENFH
ncbi:MAG: hypothetical protein WC614_13480 [bacterium]